MEIPMEIMDKIMLFNSHPVADLMRNEINRWREHHEQAQKQNEELFKKYNMKYNVSDEFGFNDLFSSMYMKKVVSDWSRFDMMIEMKRKFNLTEISMDEDYD